MREGKAMKEGEKVMTESSENKKSPPKGIAGWLIIPAIGLVLGPIKGATIFFIGINITKSAMPELMSDFRFWIIMIIDVVMIIAGISVAVFFFKKRRFAVRAIIGFMIASIVANFVQVILNISLFKEVDVEIIKPVIHACIFGAIWIPYFIRSVRVKNTFTE